MFCWSIPPWYMCWVYYKKRSCSYITRLFEARVHCTVILAYGTNASLGPLFCFD